MILYLSSAFKPSLFSDYFERGLVKTGLQAQRFNSLIIEGIGCVETIYAVGHPNYANFQDFVSDVKERDGNIQYFIIGNKNSTSRKVNNFVHLFRLCQSILKENKVDVIVCDAISPLYSLMARLLSRLYSVSTIAVVTDIPVIMDAGHKSIITTISQFLIRKHDGYVLLTEPMNRLVNPKGKPYIIMEGLCDKIQNDNMDEQPEKDVKIVLFTGSLAVQTGIYNLIEAFKQIKIKNTELWIYGGGSAEDYVKEQAKENKNIIFGGLVTNEEAANLQKKADILVNPRPTNLGYAEFSFPSKIMEYMASGTPVITTKLPGIPVEYYNYLYTFKDDSVQGILESLEGVLQIDYSLRKIKGKQARDYVLENKNKVRQGERIIELSKQISISISKI